MQSRRVTINDVARKAGVSKSAVSFAFNNPEKLLPETVELIMQKAAELGYVCNAAARAMRTSFTGSLGVLLPQTLDSVLKNPYYSLLLQGVGEICTKEGMTLLLVPPTMDSLLKSIPTAAADGFIVSGMEKERSEVVEIYSKNIPMMIVDPDVPLDAVTVSVDDQEAIDKLVKAIVQFGHKRIGIAAIETKSKSVYTEWHGVVGQRMVGILQAFEKFGLTVESGAFSVVEVPSTYEGGIRAFSQLCEQDNPPSVVVAFSDIIAQGVIAKAHESGLKIPKDISVTGYDDIADFYNNDYGLTTIHQPIVTKGRLAAKLLVQMIRQGRDSLTQTNCTLKASFRRRDTLGESSI